MRATWKYDVAARVSSASKLLKIPLLIALVYTYRYPDLSITGDPELRFTLNGKNGRLTRGGTNQNKKARPGRNRDGPSNLILND